jgi:hypothetical protein
MAKKTIIPMGKHKPLGSSWRSMDMAYSHAYEPENRPEFRCFVTGQKDAMQAAYDAHKREQERMSALLLLKQKMLDKGLL